ncbi:hypothetical protein C5167_041576 [Papaver somniferum]|uniref:uncharacterized protein LOC113328334 n=1 Tax=Papaver somniferum TaxID=3469 RepID=UPI000E704FAC|nr:uncharacterized protein LOC113328334 [Papaver somniferum]RZC85393.1 hypothetical protein C5167_041576 [Papaver somniferum]
MKFLNWMQSKINGKQPASASSKTPVAVSTKNNVVMQESREDEFSDWPHGLLAIGTFGNTAVNKGGQESSSSSKRHGHSDCNNNQIIEEEISPSSLSEVLGDGDLDDFTPEEVGKLQEELKKLLSRKPKPALTEEEQCRTLSGRRGVKLFNLLPLDKFLNCPSSLEVERKANDIDSPCQRELRRSLSVIGNMEKNLSPERTKSIKKKSITFLLKKMFVCRSGFPPPAPPTFRDSIPESRIEKLLRAMINKNLYCPKNSPTTPTAKKFLENDNYYLETDKENDGKGGDDDEQQPKEKINGGYKWDKTDDDYIVLEI